MPIDRVAHPIFSDKLWLFSDISMCERGLLSLTFLSAFCKSLATDFQMPPYHWDNLCRTGSFLGWRDRDNNIFWHRLDVSRPRSSPLRQFHIGTRISGIGMADRLRLRLPCISHYPEALSRCNDWRLIRRSPSPSYIFCVRLILCSRIDWPFPRASCFQYTCLWGFRDCKLLQVCRK